MKSLYELNINSITFNNMTVGGGGLNVLDIDFKTVHLIVIIE